MKLKERKQNSFIQKSIFLLIIMTLWICLGTGFTVNAAQREDTKLLKIYDGKSIEASQIQFKAEVATPDSNRIDIYRSEKPVSQGGKLEKLDSFRVIGDFWEVLGDNLYMNYGDNFKVQCYSHDTCVEGNLTFVDTTAKAGHQYSYRLVYGDMVYDPDSGEYSVEIVSNIIDVKANLQTPELYKCYSTDNKTVNLSWSYIAQADGYRVYRYDNGKWSFLKNVKKRNVISTTDKNVQAGKTYQYSIYGTKQKITWRSSNKSVVSIDSKGKATAKRSGYVTITATFGTYHFESYVNVNPKPTVVKTYNIGQTWKVPGQWSLRINSVTEMDERNPYSDVYPDAVYLIDYTYENLGYGDELYISMDLQRIVDAKGYTGYSYPNDQTYYPQELPVGAKCHAQGIVGVDHAGNFKIYVDEYTKTTYKKYSAIFNIKVN